ncbi:MAG: Anaphase-promoting complex subunit 1 [Piccolia ochrophora]|nr:MAG: Anaphase-promoting complex subunit 1 [Piccolia ochrophora]
MASVTSLGFHNPSGLPYLVAESILSSHPSEDEYKWTTSGADGAADTDDELLVTENCVVWSRGSVVKRVFRFDVEGERVNHAVFTYLAPEAPPRSSATTSTLSYRSRSSGWSMRAQSYSTQVHTAQGDQQKYRHADSPTTTPGAAVTNVRRALVICLQTQAHVYFLSGTSHVVHLPFEIDAVFPTSRGVLLQRKVSPVASQPSMSGFPAAPPNSFVSSNSQPTAFQGSQRSRRTAPVMPNQVSLAAKDMLKVDSQSSYSKFPRVFCLTDPLVELGLVVNATSSSAMGLQVSRTEECTKLSPMDLAEDLIYVSGPDEARQNSQAEPQRSSPLLALTINRSKRIYTVWTVNHLQTEPTSLVAKSRTPRSISMLSRRKSSFGAIPRTGTTTPGGTSNMAGRTSFGGLARGQSFGGPSSSQMQAGASINDAVDEKRQISSSLDPDFDIEGVPGAQSRRISSLLARADLSTNQDKATFSDLASNPLASHSIGIQPGSRRGESLGGYGSHSSLGPGAGYGRRGSMPTNRSFTSSEASTSDTPVDELLEELNAGGDFEGFESLALHETFEALRREVALKRIESLPMDPNTAKDYRPKVFTLVPPRESAEGSNSISVVLCLVDRSTRKLSILTFSGGEKLTVDQGLRVDKRRQSTKAKKTESFHGLRLTDVRRGSSVIDACKLVDGEASRIVVLRETPNGMGEITLQSPWSAPIKIDLPPTLAIFDPHTLGMSATMTKKRQGSMKRVLSKGPQALRGLQHEAPHGKFDVVDEQNKRHRLQIKMRPRNKVVAQVLDVCSFVLPGMHRGGEGILVGWCEVKRWLDAQKTEVIDGEWTALVVVLMLMAVPFLDMRESRHPLKQGRKSGSLRRSGSGAGIDMDCWDAMLSQEGARGSPCPEWMRSPAWNWILDEKVDLKPTESHLTQRERRSTRKSSGSYSIPTMRKKHSLLLDCVGLAREFITTDAGVAAVGPRGYLPTASDRAPEVQQTALATILVGLHLFREELKLDIATADTYDTGVGKLTAVLAQVGGWLDWEDWSWRDSAYYHMEDISMSQWLFDESIITRLATPPQPMQPPSIYDWVEKCSRQDLESPFMTLHELVSGPYQTKSALASPQSSSDRAPKHKLTPRTDLVSAVFLGIGAQPMASRDIIASMSAHGVDTRSLASFPDGIRVPLQEAIVASQANPSTTWDELSMELVGRNDVSMVLSHPQPRREYSRSHAVGGLDTDTFDPSTNSDLQSPSHVALRDAHGICNSTGDTEMVGAFDGSAEIDRMAVTRLIFREDRRFTEATKLVQSSKPSVVRCIADADWSESDLLEAQKELVQTVAVRTLAVPLGRGLLYYSARLPLLTERFPTAGFNLSCVMKPSNNTVSADKSAFTEEKVGWAFFHAGVAAGLGISEKAQGIDTSWIVFNRPAELSNRHAGLLLALGLNGHLKSIAKWVAFKYLTPKHTMTSIGLLLGLSASYLGTMDTLVTRLLSVHVTRMLPPGAAELNLSPLTQTTGIMGIGLLYCNSQHRRMSEVMLSEIEHVDYEESSTPVDNVRDEGYRLAAGFALGFINLGKGRDLKGLLDMQLVERLHALATSSKRVSEVHVLDMSTAAATVAIALIFMKSNDAALSRKIDVPDTLLQFHYVRPDILLLRTVAKHLIMWDGIKATTRWIKENLPREYRKHMELKNISMLNSENLALYNIIAGLCFSVGLRFAGSGLIEVRNLLGFYFDQFIRLCRLPALNYDQKLTRTTVRNCQDLVALSAASVMAGTGDLHIFRRLRSLHGRTDADTPYGSHLAAHMAIGVLFLGGGNFTLGTSNIATASLLCAFYPLFPNSILDNKSHLQAFRHFWVLATEPRCLVTRDVDSHRPVSIPIIVTLADGTELKRTAPCLLPDLDEIATVMTISPEHWRVTLDFARNPSHLAAFRSHQTLFVRARAAHDAGSSVFQATLQALNDTETSRHALEWLLNLPSFAGLDEAERALVIPPDAGNPVHAGTAGTVVDARLMLEKACLGGDRADRLRNLRLLFAWAERAEREGGKLRWVTSEVVERLKAAVWLAEREEG